MKNYEFKVPFRRGWVKGRGFAKSTWKSLDFTDILLTAHQPRTFLSALAATRPKIYPLKKNATYGRAHAHWCIFRAKKMKMPHQFHCACANRLEFEV